MPAPVAQLIVLLDRLEQMGRTEAVESRRATMRATLRRNGLKGVKPCPPPARPRPRLKNVRRF
jgi:hypothetical protein